MAARADPASFVAVDAGNTSLHVGLLSPAADGRLPAPTATAEFAASGEDLSDLRQWIETHNAQRTRWLIASVNSRAEERLRAALRQWGFAGEIASLTHEDVPLFFFFLMIR
ncbi:MAG: type III pantothenate kinase, partial [Planctomycetales bacterium]|nr:type III pantothenate kinase [Planctomycetales bacterium]